MRDDTFPPSPPLYSACSNHAWWCTPDRTRYTIRAKRGGSQSSYDSGGRKAQSAGAALRRYGEQALREDARALLKEWEGPLKVTSSLPAGLATLCAACADL